MRVQSAEKRTCCCGGPARGRGRRGRAAGVLQNPGYHRRQWLLKRLGARCLLPFVSAGRKRPRGQSRAGRGHGGLYAAAGRAGTGEIPFRRCGGRTHGTAFAYLAAAAARDEREKRILDRFGYCLGRWIYLIDAADDLEEDLQNGSYNAFALSRRLTAGDAAALWGEARRYAEGSLNATLAECEAAYNLLDIRRFDGILRNVLELGLPYVQKQALFGDPQSKSGKRRKREDPNYD